MTNTNPFLTITLTDRAPVKIKKEDWPIIAEGDQNDDDSNQPGNSPNREWKRTIKVRQHADGRALVYGVYEYETCFQGESGAAARRGVMLAAGEDVIASVRLVASHLSEAEEEAAISDEMKESQRWRAAAQECIADLPAEELDGATRKYKYGVYAREENDRYVIHAVRGEGAFDYDTFGPYEKPEVAEAIARIRALPESYEYTEDWPHVA